MNNDKTLELLKELSKCTDIDKIAESLSFWFLKEFDAEGIEVKILNSNLKFDRVFFCLRENPSNFASQQEIKNRFGPKNTPLNGSLIGHAIKEPASYLWSKTEKESFEEFIKKNDIPIHIESARIYAKSFPSGELKNFLIIPVLCPLLTENEPQLINSLCFHFFNILGGGEERIVLADTLEKINEIFALVQPHINAILLRRAVSVDNIIERKIENLVNEGKDFEDVLEEVLSHFADKLKSPINSLWFYNPDYKLLGLHYVLIKDNFTDLKIDKEKLLGEIFDRGLNVLHQDKSVLGNFARMSDNYLIVDKLSNETKSFNWDFIFTEYKLDKFVGFCLRHQGEIIAIMGLHPTINSEELEKSPLVFQNSFLIKLGRALNYLSAKSFEKKSQNLIEKLKSLQNKKPEIILSNFAYKITEVIGAEICSIFEVRHADPATKGVYLVSTSDKSSNAKNFVGKKIYDINNDSITGFVANTMKPINVYDIINVNKFYPDINGYSKMCPEVFPGTSLKTFIAVTTRSPDEKKSPESFYLIFCLNKNGSKNNKNYLFSQQDIHLLKHFGVILNRYIDLLDVIKGRNELLDLIIHEIESPIVTARSRIDYIKTTTM
ncbi:MAG: hypothetical protein HY965_00385, partial [Ignavibacteriales bacterium]|nr:hypothetical protein [Ignavibacteriales bacterium]